MACFHPRFVWTAPPLPRLLPDERLLFSKENVWYFSYRLPAWQFGESLPVPLLIGLFFYITDKRAVTVVRHSKTLDIEMIQWRPQAAAPEASEVLTSVRVGTKHFGSVKFDFFGLGKGHFGIGRTPFGKQGGDVPYLEFTSKRHGALHARTVQIYMGVGKEAKEELDAAHSILLEDFQEG